MTKNEISNILNLLGKSICLAHDYYSIYESMYNAFKTRSEEMNISPGFFNVTKMAIRQALCIETSKIFDTDERTYSLHNIMNLCSKHFPETRSDIEILYKKEIEIEKHINNIKNARNKYFAHNDKRIENFPNYLADNAVSMIEFKGVLNYIVEVYNVLSKHLENPWFFIPRNINDLTKMLNKLHNSKE